MIAVSTWKEGGVSRVRKNQSIIFYTVPVSKCNYLVKWSSFSLLTKRKIFVYIEGVPSRPNKLCTARFDVSNT